MGAKGSSMFIRRSKNGIVRKSKSTCSNLLSKSSTATPKSSRGEVFDDLSSSAIPMSKSEIILLAKSWERANCKSDVAMIIITKLLNDKEIFRTQLKVDLPMNKHVTPKQIRDDFHPATFVGDGVKIFLDKLVQKICSNANDNEIVLLCKNAGLAHYTRNVSFGAENWLSVKRATIESIVECPVSDEDRETIFVWNRVMMFVIREMKKAYLQESLRACGNGQAHNGETFNDNDAVWGKPAIKASSSVKQSSNFLHPNINASMHGSKSAPDLSDIEDNVINVTPTNKRPPKLLTVCSQ